MAEVGDQKDEAVSAETNTEKQLKERKSSWAKLRRVDSLNLEAGRVSNKAHSHASGVLNYWIHLVILACLMV